jgi:hypothetical protein
MGGAVAREHINELAFGFGDDALVLLLCDLQMKGLNTLHSNHARLDSKALSEQVNTSSALSSAKGLAGLLEPPTMLETFPELSST